MRKRSLLESLAVALATLVGAVWIVGPRDAAANGLDVWFLPETGHYYAIVGPVTEVPNSPPGTSWGSSKTDAETKFFMGVQGHLATLNSAAENDLIEQKLADREECFAPERSGPANSFRFGPWIGGSRADSTSDFEWLGEGPFADKDGVALPGGFEDFVNPPEPNGQMFVTFIRFTQGPASPALGWADCTDSACFGGQNRQGPICYVVEFDVPPPPEPRVGCGGD